ncbi:MAG: leucine-rich repeat domain-containing protein [Clostridia bacterium]|nr:leucine-rich repeat domain-containing protein [Clostridia bacterium]
MDKYNINIINTWFIVKVKNGKKILYKYLGSESEIKIPDEIEIIGEDFKSAFVRRNNNVKSIVISNSVTSISFLAFNNCTELEHIEIPSSVKTIYVSAFNDCEKLKYNEYENGLYLGNKENPYYALIKVKDKNISSFKIHNDTMIIADGINGGGVFQDCVNLSKIEFTNNIKVISDSLFQNCTSLETIKILDSVEKIYGWTFKNCKNLTSIEIPSSVNEIGTCAFENCNKLERVEGVINDIGQEAFKNCSKLKTIKLSNEVKNIDWRAFKNCISLENLEIPSSVNEIGYNAFVGCTNLKYNEYENCLYLGNSENPYYALISAKDKEITSYKVHKDTRVIASGAFEDCKKLKTINFSEHITSLDGMCFKNCLSLESVEIPNTITEINLYVFEECKKLRSIVIPSSVKWIDPYAFYLCENLILKVESGSYAEDYAKKCDDKLSAEKYRIKYEII